MLQLIPGVRVVPFSAAPMQAHAAQEQAPRTLPGVKTCRISDSVKHDLNGIANMGNTDSIRQHWNSNVLLSFELTYNKI
ncbi:hypothetical protein V6N13_126810 [Hibiscus sabdariffa]